MNAEFILTMSCPDRAGIVAATTGCMSQHSAFITETAHFADTKTNRFFGRVCFHFEGNENLAQCFERKFSVLADDMDMVWNLYPVGYKPRVLIMVSKADHCLNDILYRHQKGTLNIDIAAIASNHPDLKTLADWRDLPFYHLPISKESKVKQEAQILNLMESLNIDFLILARYMQILSDKFCQQLEGRAINIHHSFLPGFKGARPYHQAHDRGVKLIGATAHFVTSDLDEGPIIEQSVERVNHTATAENMAVIGRDVECKVLARAISFLSDHRVFLNGTRTVVLK